jgi:hypothetical protein
MCQRASAPLALLRLVVSKKQRQLKRVVQADELERFWPYSNLSRRPFVKRCVKLWRSEENGIEGRALRPGRADHAGED